MSADPALEYLLSLTNTGVRPGLDPVRRLAELAGNPHASLRFIHVAGTNGKGSTCAFLEAVCRRAGLKTGLYTSPHLVSITERIQVGRAPIAPEKFSALVSELRGLVETHHCKVPFTFFDFVTVLAWMHFARERCDVVILETGLGGRLDSTNLVTPLASIITTIDFDHMDWLGDTLAKIAFEKAGILKPRVPAVTGVSQPEAIDVIRARARELDAPLTEIRPGSEFYERARALDLRLRGEHQTLNAALALATIAAVKPALGIACDAAAERAVEAAEFPGRLQRETLPDGRELLLDGAHNPAGARALRAALDSLMPPPTATLVIGVMTDKNWREIAAILAPDFARILAVRVGNPRALPPEELAAALRVHNPVAAVDIAGSVPEALSATARDRRIVVTGSLYLVGEMLGALGLTTGVTPDALPLGEKLELRNAKPEGITKPEK